MWMTRDIWMNGDGKHKLVIFSMEEIKMISPEILDIPWIYPAMRVGDALMNILGDSQALITLKTSGRLTTGGISSRY
jgi:hypothetical protein